MDDTEPQGGLPHLESPAAPLPFDAETTASSNRVLLHLYVQYVEYVAAGNETPRALVTVTRFTNQEAPHQQSSPGAARGEVVYIVVDNAADVDSHVFISADGVSTTSRVRVYPTAGLLTNGNDSLVPVLFDTATQTIKFINRADGAGNMPGIDEGGSLPAHRLEAEMQFYQ